MTVVSDVRAGLQRVTSVRQTVEVRLRRLKASLTRQWHSSPATFGFRMAWARWRNAVSRDPNPITVLLVTDGAAYTSDLQYVAILRHATLLRKRLGVVAQIRKLDAALRLDRDALSRFGLVGLKLSFKTPPEKAERLAEHFKRALTGATTRLVYFDGDDDVGVQWPAVLRATDLYVKKQVFTDKKAYQSHYVGKSNLTDYVARKYGVSFAANIIPTSGGLEPDAVSRIHLGWNLALDEPILELLQRMKSVPADGRDYDITCRATVPQDNWLRHLRIPAISTIEAMSARFRVLVPHDRVPRTAYWDELIRSKICVSPFGYGEICWRDFEAIMCGSLLVKPNMSHLETLPNLFAPGETYVPIKWDYSDLEEKCEFYLKNENERKRIARQARDHLVSCLRSEWFVNRFRDLLIQAGVKL